MLLALSVSLWAIVIGIRLVHLQVLGREFFEQQGTRQSERTLNLDPRRGPILDRAGRPLAVSVDAESLYAVPQDVVDAPATAQALARALSLDAAGRREVLARLQQKSKAFVWVQRKLDPGTARRVRELQLDGIGFLTEHRRYYPQRELAAHVLGYVGLDNEGMSGIEHALEKEIRGRAAKVVVHTDARRRPVAQTERPSTDGAAVTLTIDEAVQHIAERELERSMAETQAAGRHGGRGRALHGRGAGDGGPSRLQPEPLQRLPELALAEPRRLRRLRARLDLQDRHRRGRHPGERRDPGRGARLRQRPDRDRRHRDQRPRRVRAPELHARPWRTRATSA